MLLRNSIKKYNRGIHKVIPPEITYQIISKSLKELNPPLIKKVERIYKKTHISQYRIILSHNYRNILQNCMPVHPVPGSHGKGHTNILALVSGLMELVERYSCCQHLGDRNNFIISSFKKMENNRFTYEDFLSFSKNKYHNNLITDGMIKNTEIIWYKGYSLEGEEVFLPMSMLCYLFEGSNGMAAGNTLEEAIIQGVCEIIERHCTTILYLNKLSTPFININSIKNPIINKLIKKFQMIGNEIFIKDFSLDIGIPVIGVIRRVNNNKFLISAGCATSPEEALIRALTENSQIEHVSQYDDRANIKNYLTGNRNIPIQKILDISDSNIKVELFKIAELLKIHKMKIYFINTTNPILKIPTVYVCITNTKFYYESKDYRNILLSLIEDLLKIQNYNQAECYIEIGLLHDGYNRNIYLYYKGIILSNKNRYGNAINLFKLSLDSHSRHEYTYYPNINIGLCYQALNQLPEAIKFYISNINLFPEIDFYFLKKHYCINKPDIINTAAEIYELLRKYKCINQSLNNPKIIRIVSEYPKMKNEIIAILKRFKYYFSRKRYKKAIQFGKKILKLNYLIAYVNNIFVELGFCYGELGQYTKAIVNLKKADRIDKTALQTNLLLFKYFNKIGRYHEANIQIKKVINKMGAKDAKLVLM